MRNDLLVIADMRRCALGLVVATLLLGSCTSASSDVSQASDSAATGQVASPLADFLGLGATEDYASALELRRAESIEATIDECMGRLGFEYNQTPISRETVFGEVFGAELDRLTYAQTYGLSVSTLFEESLFEPSIESGLDEQDPNAEILDQLSPAELDLWLGALRGSQVLVDPVQGTAIDPETGDVVTDTRSLGCIGEAQETANRKFSGLIGLLPQLEELQARVEGDDRVSSARLGWSRCMAEQGYSFANHQEMWTAAFTDFRPLQAEILDAVRGGGGSSAIEIDEDGDSSQTSRIPRELVARLDEHKAAEISTAVASYECDSGIDAVRSEVRAELEQGFISDNREALDALTE